MTIGEKLAKLRTEHNLTQEQLAEVLHVSRQSVSKWELNTSYPDTEKLIKISKLFDCSLDYLLKDEIERMDLTVSSETEKENRLEAAALAYLSFPPVIGWIIGFFSIRFQLAHMRNRKMIIISAAGMVFSIVLTMIMAAGIIFEL